MTQTWLISGPPGCGKTNWILNALKSHAGPCGYLRLEGGSRPGLEQGRDSSIDWNWLKDQIPQLTDLRSNEDSGDYEQHESTFKIVELSQFQTLRGTEPDGVNTIVKAQLEELNLKPQRIRHFGEDPELPKGDTLDYNTLESLSIKLNQKVWDPNSLSSFWFELVNGAYGDVYRAKALMNLPDGRAFYCNWIVTQKGSQFLPLNAVEQPNGRPKRQSALVLQGKALNGPDVQSTIHDCLLNDDVLEMHQAQRRSQQPNPYQPAL
ncbi:ATPase [Synechococcus sp. MIT S1220]|uniref:ATPase n=1 Tax=Synechococcus sp. MIT S1220 TaxID=3082549 RepID=UPI0039AECB1B